MHADWRRKLRTLKTEELRRSLSVTQELYRNELGRQQQRLQVNLIFLYVSLVCASALRF